MRRRTFLQAGVGSLATCLLPGAAPAADRPPRRARWAETVAHNQRVVAGLLGLGAPLLTWRGVVIHHTAHEWSSKPRIDAYHRRRFDDPLGCEYHFLVHNGKRGPEGWIEPARWPHQARAIHLFKPWLAPDAVAVSLIGNFEERRPRERQLGPVVELVRALTTQLGIPPERVTTHRRVDGRLTQCPGKHFPYEAVIRRLHR